jgi:hypothetical protein
MWMQTTAEISGISYLMETSVPAPRILDPCGSQDRRSLAIRVFYREHRAPTVEGAIERLERFAADVRLDGSRAIRLRAGEPDFLHQLGSIDPILPPVAPQLEIRVDEIGASSEVSLLIVFVTTFRIILIRYRSLVIATLLTASFATASLSALAVQAVAGIAIHINTLSGKAMRVGRTRAILAANFRQEAFCSIPHGWRSGRPGRRSGL